MRTDGHTPLYRCLKKEQSGLGIECVFSIEANCALRLIMVTLFRKILGSQRQAQGAVWERWQFVSENLPLYRQNSYQLFFVFGNGIKIPKTVRYRLLIRSSISGIWRLEKPLEKMRHCGKVVALHSTVYPPLFRVEFFLSRNKARTVGFFRMRKLLHHSFYQCFRWPMFIFHYLNRVLCLSKITWDRRTDRRTEGRMDGHDLLQLLQFLQRNRI